MVLGWERAVPLGAAGVLDLLKGCHHLGSK
jgi:hypothetical protein